jgi:hypothetical protein
MTAPVPAMRLAPEAAEDQGRDPENDEQHAEYDGASIVDASDQRDAQDDVPDATAESFEDYTWWRLPVFLLHDIRHGHDLPLLVEHGLLHGVSAGGGAGDTLSPVKLKLGADPMPGEPGAALAIPVPTLTSSPVPK